MVEPQYVVAVVISGLGAVAFFMIVSWAKRWEVRMTAQDERLNKHEVQHSDHKTNLAVLKNDLDHIKTTSDQTAVDVKELLQREPRTNRSKG